MSYGNQTSQEKLNGLLTSYLSRSVENDIKNNLIKTGLQLYKVRVTPELAQKLLDKYNVKNRGIRRSKLNELVTSINNGDWNPDNGEAITITKNNVMSNGQHRLRAIVKTGVTIDMHIILNVSNESIKTIDTGANRTARDLLTLENIKFAKIIPAYLKLKKAFLSGSGRLHTNDRISNVGILNMVDGHEDEIYEYISKATKFSAKSSLISISEYAVYYDLFNMASNEVCEEFFEYFTENTHLLMDDHPVARLKKNLHRNKTTVSGNKYSTTARRAMVIMAWNMFYSGKDSVKVLKYDPRNSFPKVKGLDYNLYSDENILPSLVDQNN